MGFRFRRSTRVGPLRFNFANSGLSSISLGGRGASINIPVGRNGSLRTTVGLPGTGLSWSKDLSSDRLNAIPAGDAEGLPNSRRLRPSQLNTLTQTILRVLRQRIFAPGMAGALLWENGVVSRLLSDGSIGTRTAGLLAIIETPETMEAFLLRSQSQDDAKRRARRCIEAAKEASRIAASRGWLA
jgi:hypothetical protein